MRIGVALVTWNGGSYLQACLNSILSQTRPPNAVCIVDNGSTDASPHIIYTYAQTFKWREIDCFVIENDNNTGFTHAANQSLSSLSSSCDAIFLLNQDTSLDITCLEAVERALHTYPKAGAIGCKIFYPDHKTIQHAGAFLERPRLFGAHRGSGDADAPHYQIPYEPEYVTAAAIAIRTRALQDVGSFDPVFSPGYYEETDLCFRMREHGWRIQFAPDATLIHHESASFRLRPDHQLIVHRNRLLFASFWLRAKTAWDAFESAESSSLEISDLPTLQTLTHAYARALLSLVRQTPPRSSPRALTTCVRLLGIATGIAHRHILSPKNQQPVLPPGHAAPA